MDDHVRIQRQRERPAVVRLWQALQPLKSVITFMNTGAHPDDETSAMLAALALRDGMRTVFVCSTRGEGGQNALGTEAGHDLGALRTREMEVAAEAIGLDVCWLSESAADPITDFGFSKHADETLRIWGEERTVERLVRAIRRERPDIVCPTFLDVPGQHGHHRAMTQAAHRAVVLAADPSAFPSQFEEGLTPWQVSKLYLPAWSGAGQSYDDALPPPNATVVVDTGGRDPVLGATYAQIAQWSRAGHKTQGMGKWLDAGDDSRPLHLAWSSLGETSEETNIAEGLPRSLVDLASMSDDAALREALGAADREIAAALQAWPDAGTVGEAAARALAAVRTALALSPDPIRHRLTQKEAQLARVMFEASGLAVRAAVTPAIATPGSRVRIDVHLDMRDMHLDGAPRLSLGVPENWSAIPPELVASRPHESLRSRGRSRRPLERRLPGRLQAGTRQRARASRRHILDRRRAGLACDRPRGAASDSAAGRCPCRARGRGLERQRPAIATAGPRVRPPSRVRRRRSHDRAGDGGGLAMRSGERSRSTLPAAIPSQTLRSAPPRGRVSTASRSRRTGGPR